MDWVCFLRINYAVSSGFPVITAFIWHFSAIIVNLDKVNTLLYYTLAIECAGCVRRHVKYRTYKQLKCVV